MSRSSSRAAALWRNARRILAKSGTRAQWNARQEAAARGVRDKDQITFSFKNLDSASAENDGPRYAESGICESRHYRREPTAWRLQKD